MMQIICGEQSIKGHTVNENDFKYILGRYETEERAKEVLREMIDAYRSYRTAVLEETAVYEMPKE